jgi:hypothetical protein
MLGLSLRATILHQKLGRAPPMKLAAEDVAELDQRKEDGKDKIQRRRRLGFEEET